MSSPTYSCTITLRKPGSISSRWTSSDGKRLSCPRFRTASVSSSKRSPRGADCPRGESHALVEPCLTGRVGAVVEQNAEIDVALAVRSLFGMAAEEVDGH